MGITNSADKITAYYQYFNTKVNILSQFIPIHMLKTSSLYVAYPEDGYYHTLMMVDVDAPYPENNYNSPYLHYLVTNIPSSDLEGGEVIVEYMRPNPRPDSQKHKYLILLYKQSEVIPTIKVEAREKFNYEEFVKKFNMSLMKEMFFYTSVGRTVNN